MKPERFDQFKTKIREVWPVTFLNVVLPLGVITSRRNRASGNLLPSMVPQAKREKNKNGAPVPEPSPEDFTLPADPAPALLCGSPSPTGENGTPSDDAGESPEVSTSETGARPRSAAAFSDPTSSASRPRDKKRRRRSRNAGWRKAVQIGFYAVIALVVIYFLIIANLRKG